MSKDKYLSIFSPQMATIVFIILQIFFTTRTVLKIGEAFRPIARKQKDLMDYIMFIIYPSTESGGSWQVRPSSIALFPQL